MITLTLTPAAPTAVSRTAAAIKSLMSMYEQGEGIDDGEDEVELMVLLSGMVGGDAQHPGSE